MAGAKLAAKGSVGAGRRGSLGGVGNGCGPAFLGLSLEFAGGVTISNVADHSDCVGYRNLWSSVFGYLGFTLAGFGGVGGGAPVHKPFSLDRGNHSPDHGRRRGL